MMMNDDDYSYLYAAWNKSGSRAPVVVVVVVSTAQATATC